MDDPVAFCKEALRERGDPPYIELDDVVQEWWMAQLEGNDPKAVITSYIKKAMRENKRSRQSDKMHLWPDVRLGEEKSQGTDSDEEWADYLDFEREIEAEKLKELWDKCEKGIDRLDKQEGMQQIEAIRMRMGIGCKPMKLREIAKELRVDLRQAKHLVDQGLERLNKAANPKKVRMPLYPDEEENEIVEHVKVYKTTGRPHFRRQEKDMF